MPIFFALASITFGIGSFAYGNPAGLPVFGLAFAAAGFLRESRASKRSFVFILLAVGVIICAYATYLSLRLNAK